MVPFTISTSCCLTAHASRVSQPIRNSQEASSALQNTHKRHTFNESRSIKQLQELFFITRLQKFEKIHIKMKKTAYSDESGDGEVH